MHTQVFSASDTEYGGKTQENVLILSKTKSMCQLNSANMVSLAKHFNNSSVNLFSSVDVVLDALVPLLAFKIFLL